MKKLRLRLAVAFVVLALPTGAQTEQVLPTACSPPAVTITATATSICSGGSATLDAGAGYASYLWSTGATTQAIEVTPSSTATFSVTVTDVTGCSATASQAITVTPTPSAGVSIYPPPDNPADSTVYSCSSNAAVLTATYASPGTRYLWSTGATTQSIQADQSGIYTVVVSNGGCSATSAPLHVVAYTPDPAYISGPSAICYGDSATLYVAAGCCLHMGPKFYGWSTGDMRSWTVVSPTVTTTYQGSVTDMFGCTSIGSKTVMVVPRPTAMITLSGPDAICHGQSVTLTASPGTSYRWSTGETTQSIKVASAGTYTVDVSNGVCSTTSAATTVTTYPLAIATINGPSNMCAGDTVTLTATGGATYRWSTGETAAAIRVSPAVTTNYTLDAVDANGCVSTASHIVNVTDIGTPVVSAPAAVVLSSTGNVASVSDAPAGTTYSWWMSDGLITSGNGTPSITFTAPAASGPFTIRVVETNGACVASSSATIEVISISADLELLMAAAPEPVNAGAELTYTIRVTNNGPDAASGVTIANQLPAGVTLVGVDGPVTYSLRGTVLTCTLSSALPAGSFAIVTIRATAPLTQQTMVNTALVSSDIADQHTGNNTASAKSHVIMPRRRSVLH